MLWFEPLALTRDADGKTLDDEVAWVSRGQRHGRLQCAL